MNSKTAPTIALLATHCLMARPIVDSWQSDHSGGYARIYETTAMETAPYMHDGRFVTLEEVVAHYTNGIHPSDTLDPNLAKHPKEGLPLSSEDQAALVAFLKSLADPGFANRPKQNP